MKADNERSIVERWHYAWPLRGI